MLRFFLLEAMNRILIEEKKDEYVLSSRDKRFEHARGVLRLKAGDVFDVGVVNGSVGKAQVVEIGKREFRFKVIWGSESQELRPVHLCMGLPRPQTAKKILFQSSVFGVQSVSFFCAGKTTPQYVESSLWQHEKWRESLIEGAEQAFGTKIPEFRLVKTLDELELKSISNPAKIAMDNYEARSPLGAYEFSRENPIILAIGPEGGWSGKDRKELRSKGFEFFSMGKQVFRCETAMTVALTLIYDRMGWF